MNYHIGEEFFSVFKEEVIKISYKFRRLTPDPKGAFYEYRVVDSVNPDDDYAKIDLQYKRDKKYPVFSCNTGNIDGQKANTNTFRLFQHYYT